MGGKNELNWWNAADGEQIREVEIHGNLQKVAFSTDGELLAAAIEISTGEVDVLLFERDGKPMGRLGRCGPELNYLDFSADGRYLTVVDKSFVVHIFDVPNGKRIARFTADFDDFEQPSAALVVGEEVITAHYDMRFCRWDLADLTNPEVQSRFRAIADLGGRIRKQDGEYHVVLPFGGRTSLDALRGLNGFERPFVIELTTAENLTEHVIGPLSDIPGLRRLELVTSEFDKGLLAQFREQLNGVEVVTKDP